MNCGSKRQVPAASSSSGRCGSPPRRAPDWSLSFRVSRWAAQRVAIVVLDASVAIAFLDAADPHHSGAVAALTRLQGSDLVLPASAYAEMLVGPARRSRAALDAAREFVVDLGLRIEPISA